MKEPKRILARGVADDLGTELLTSAASDRPRPGAHDRALKALGLGVGGACATAAVASTSSAGAAAKAGATGVASVSSATALGAKAGVSTVGAAVLAKWTIVGAVAGAVAIGTVENAPAVLRTLRSESSAQSTSAPPIASQAWEAGAAPGEVTIDSDPDQEPAETVGEVDSGQDGSASPTPPASRPASSTSAKDVISGGGEAKEVWLLDRTREALRRGDATEASRLIDAYVEAFPDGKLAQEAQVLRVECLWKSGRVHEASNAANRFEQDYPQSPLRKRLREVVQDSASTAGSSGVPVDPFGSRF